MVARILVRVYNEQPGFVMQHEEATAFCKGLVTWVNSQAKTEDLCRPPEEGEPRGAPLVHICLAAACLLMFTFSR